MKPFDYTGKKLVSKKVWEQKCKAEINKRKKAKRGKWAPYKNTPTPYEARYGTKWEEELRKRSEQDGSVRTSHG